MVEQADRREMYRIGIIVSQWDRTACHA